MKKSDIKNKKILVVEIARSGLATVEVLCRQGAYVLCQDSKWRCKPQPPGGHDAEGLPPLHGGSRSAE